MDTQSNRAGLDPDPRPELYSIDGSVPPEVMQRYGEWVGRNPRHPGRHLVGTLERKSLSRDEAAALFGVERADLDEVLAERAPVTAELAVRMQAAGGMPAIIWMRMQIRYDLVQARRRLVRSGAIPPDAVPADLVGDPPDADAVPDPEHAPVPSAETEPAAAVAG